MSKFATWTDRENAIKAEIARLAKKRDYAADVMSNQILAWSYQMSIDKLAELLRDKP